MSDLDPAVLRERARRLERRVQLHRSGDTFPAYTSGDARMMERAAADERLLADLLDAIPDTYKRRCGYGAKHGDCSCDGCRIAAVLEAHRD